MNVYPFIEAEKAQQWNVKRAWELLKVSRAAYYAARGGQPADQNREDAELTVLITAEHNRSRGRYGAPRRRGDLPLRPRPSHLRRLRRPGRGLPGHLVRRPQGPMPGTMPWRNAFDRGHAGGPMSAGNRARWHIQT